MTVVLLIQQKLVCVIQISNQLNQHITQTRRRCYLDTKLAQPAHSSNKAKVPSMVMTQLWSILKVSYSVIYDSPSPKLVLVLSMHMRIKKFTASSLDEYIEGFISILPSFWGKVQRILSPQQQHIGSCTILLI